MRKIVFFLSVLLLMITTAYAVEDLGSEYYGAGLCTKKGYKCITVQSGQTWQNLFPNEEERDLIQRLNRSDTYLGAGKKLVVPDNMQGLTIFDISPFPLHIKPLNEKIIIVNQEQLAWSAYDAQGNLVKWGPISSGKDYCPDIHRSCRTITGIYYTFHKKGEKCKSNIFPVGEGGSIMPYCMFFYKGYALHGSEEVYGRRASHGCVRLFKRDAQWLNENFVDVATKEGALGTKVVIQKLVQPIQMK